MARNQHGGAVLQVHLVDNACYVYLRRWVEIVERLVENEYFGVHYHGSDDADFLSVALGKVANELSGAHNLVAHQRFEALQTFCECCAVDAVDACNEVEELFWCIVIDEKALVYKRTSVFLPLETLVYRAAIR